MRREGNFLEIPTEASSMHRRTRGSIHQWGGGGHCGSIQVRYFLSLRVNLLLTKRAGVSFLGREKPRPLSPLDPPEARLCLPELFTEALEFVKTKSFPHAFGVNLHEMTSIQLSHLRG